MKTTRATATTHRRASRIPRLGNERGMLLVITMIILLVISTLASANLINAFLERSLAKNQNNASIALNAADAGIDAGIAWLSDPANKPSIPVTGVAWTRAGDPQVRTLGSGGRYSVTISTKVDTQDRDKDGDTTDIVLYNKVAPTAAQGDAANNGKFGYLDAKEEDAGQGYPVIVIRSQGSYGAAGYREIVVEVGRTRDIPPGVKGAVTSVDPVNFGDSAAQAKDGRGHALNGLLCTDAGASPACECPDTLPGLMVESGTLASSDIGNSTTVFPNPVITENSGAPLCATAECVLGYNDAAGNPSRAVMEAAARENGMIFGPSPPDTPIDNGVISAALETMPQGALIIVKGNLTLTAGTDVDAAHAKRLVVDGTFDAQGNTEFTGLIVAQNFDTCGNLIVNGGVVCTGDSNAGTSPFANGNVTLNYSCDSLAAAAGQQGYSVRLGWQRLF